MVLKHQRSFHLPILSHPQRKEGPMGYLLRLSESNLLSIAQLNQVGISYDYGILEAFGLLPHEKLDPELHCHVRNISEIKQSKTQVFNEKYARYCPLCLDEHNEWRVEWELFFYDVCHLHGVWLVDQCTSCGSHLTWNRSHLNRCTCGATLNYEDKRTAPKSMVLMAAQMSQKILPFASKAELSAPMQSTNIEQTQKLIRYFGNYMTSAPTRNPLKMKEAGDLRHSWPVTTLAAEMLNQWPEAFHLSLTNLENQHVTEGRPSLNDVFGQAYHYVYEGLKSSVFDEVRTQFELWISAQWKGGIAKRNTRLMTIMLEEAAWIPALAACDFLGISLQRLELLIREGTLEGETHISEKGRKFTMVRRDNLEVIKEQLFGMIDMNTAKNLLGFQKRRMRQMLTFLFKDAKKLGSSPSAQWAISRQEINNILDKSIDVPVVSISDEDCVSLGHVLQFWTWSNQEIANLIHAVKDGEILITNKLDTDLGVAAWNFKLQVLNNWKKKFETGLSEWMTITQAAIVLGIKEQVAYELVNLDFLGADVMPFQKKRGTRVRLTAIEKFNKQYIFATKVAEQLGCSPKKVISNLSSFGIKPVSGPLVNGARQVLFQREQVMNLIEKENI